MIGGGAGGLITSSKLSAELSEEIKQEKVSITVFEGAETQEFQPGYLEVAFRGTDPQKLRRPMEKLLSPGVKVVHAKCASLDLDNHQIVTAKNQEKYDFDYVVVSTGCSPDYSQAPGLREENLDFYTDADVSSRIYKTLQGIKSGRVVVGIAGLPYKCPPSPNEAAFMVDEYLRRHGIRKNVDITFITPYTRIYTAEPINEVISPLYDERNIEARTVFNTDSVDPVKKEISSLEGDTVKYDYLFLTPPHKPASFLKETSYSDEDGWVKVDKLDLHITDHDFAFAIGDTNNIPTSKAGVEAHLEGIVVANNIAMNITGKGTKHLFTGRTQCSMETGFHDATFVVGTYDRPVEKIKPSKINYAEKKVMEHIYWGSLHGHYEWLFK
ncbi:FAD-dependent pyridine nucleotide-disulfide oxidoreductase, partial [mine drainage metagenome]